MYESPGNVAVKEDNISGLLEGMRASVAYNDILAMVRRKFMLDDVSVDPGATISRNLSRALYNACGNRDMSTKIVEGWITVFTNDPLFILGAIQIVGDPAQIIYDENADRYEVGWGVEVE